MAANDITPNLISEQTIKIAAQQSSSHGGAGRNQGRKPAHKASSKAVKPNPDVQLQVLSVKEEQRYWRTALDQAKTTATTAPDAKTAIAATEVLMNGLRSVSELRRGRSYVAAPPQQENNSELAQLLRGLVPSEVKKQRKGRRAASDSTDQSAETSDTQQTPDPSTQNP